MNARGFRGITMRIGIDATSWMNRRGFGRFVRELTCAIAGLSTDDEYVLFADRQTAERARFPEGWRVQIADTSASPVEAAASDGRRSIRDMWTMRRLVASEPLDLVFFPAVYSYYPVGGRTPCVVTFHDVIAETLPHLIFENRLSRFLWNGKTRSALRRSSCALTVSEASKKGLMKEFGLAPDYVRVISEAPSRHFQPVSEPNSQHQEILGRYDLRPDEEFFLYVGGISPHKNIDTLIRAFAEVTPRVPNPTRLILVGDYEGDVFRTCHADLTGLVADLKITDRVSFTGFVPDEDLPHLFSASQAFVFPSFLEGFGLPAVEAMACGAAVVVTDRGSVPEVVGGAGHLFDPYDVQSLVDGLIRIASDEQYRQELRARSLARAEDFSWERSARQAVQIFHEFGR